MISKLTALIIKHKVVLICAVLILMSIPSIRDYARFKITESKGYSDINEMSEQDFAEGKLVKGTVHRLIGEFAFYGDSKAGKTAARNSAAYYYYIMPLAAGADGEVKFVVLRINSADKADKMVDEYWNYLETGDDPEFWTEFNIAGTVSPLNGELLEFFYEWFGADGSMTRSDIESMVCPYVIESFDPAMYDDGLTEGIILAAAGVIGIVTVILYKKHLKRQAAASEQEFTELMQKFKK